MEHAASCEGKERFTSVALARAVARRKGRMVIDGTTAVFYRCRFCGGWHVGSGSKKHSKVKRDMRTKGRKKFNPMKELQNEL